MRLLLFLSFCVIAGNCAVAVDGPTESFWSIFSLPQLPSWAFFVLGVGITLYVQAKLFNIKKPSETALVQRELALIRADDLASSKHKTYTGYKNVPFTQDQFRHWMKLITEFAIDYFEHPEVFQVTTSGTPGFIYNRMPHRAPNNPEPFENVLRDLYKIIMPGLTHWQHPRFHAYFAAGLSYPDIIAECIASAVGTVNFCWDSSPAFTELEIVMVNWVGRCFGIPEIFLFTGDNSERCQGGGSMQDSASDAILVAMLSARHKRIKEACGEVDMHQRDKEHVAIRTLVAYGSKEAHSCIEKAALFALVHMRPVTPDKNFSMRGSELKKECEKDRNAGRVPFFVHVTLGTTGTGAYDNLKEIIEVAKEYDLWVHVDAAYGGNAWVCPEYRYQMEGIEHADTINVNLHKIFLHSTAATFLWARNQRFIKEAMVVDPSYLKPRQENATDFRHWSINLSRRARCLKTWFILRTYGISGMQEYIRRLIRLTRYFKSLLEKDPRVEIVGEQIFSLVCFKIKAPTLNESNKLTKGFCDHINKSQQLVVTHAECHAGKDTIDIVRISISHQRSLEKEVKESYEIMSDLLEEFLNKSRFEVPSQIAFDSHGGIIGSPALSTSDTMLTRSTSSTQSFVGAQSPASSASGHLNLLRDPQNLKNYPELPSERTPTTDGSRRTDPDNSRTANNNELLKHRRTRSNEKKGHKD